MSVAKRSAPARQIRSHAARDMLHVADEFSTLPKAVWEYVANGLQYVEPGRPPRVEVRVEPRAQRLTIQDNGRGMDSRDLDRFLTMHAPNEERLRGQPGRGVFGTGKAAAFGIGKVLRVTSVKGGRMWQIEIRRADLEARAQDPTDLDVPVRTLADGRCVGGESGVRIEVEGFRLRITNRDVERLGSYLTNRLRRYPAATVTLNGRPCVPTEIATLPEYDRRVPAPAEIASVIGDAVLTLRVAAGTLDPDTRGVYAWISGQRLSLGLCGNEGNRWAPRIFGDVDADGLDPDLHPEWPSPFSQGRREEIELANPGAMQLWGWVGFEVERLIEELEEEERQKRDALEQRRLRSIAREIADVLNRDYSRDEESPMNRSRPVEGPDPATAAGGEEPGMTPPLPESGGGGGGGAASSGEAAPTREPELDADDAGEPSARREPANPGPRRRQGGFVIRFEHMGAGDDRGRYDPESHAIIINLDHPEVLWAQGQGRDVEFVLYREIAFVEYAFALGQHQAQSEGGALALESMRFLVDTRERVHRVTRRVPAGAGQDDDAAPA